MESWTPERVVAAIHALSGIGLGMLGVLFAAWCVYCWSRKPSGKCKYAPKDSE